MSVIADFVSGLPSYDKDNFSKVPTTLRSTKPPSTYVETKDSPAEVIIVNDETNVLLRYLNRKWAKEERAKTKRRRDDVNKLDAHEGSSACTSTPCPKKRRKLEQDEDST